MARNISKKRKFVADGVFFAELSEVSDTAMLWLDRRRGSIAALARIAGPWFGQSQFRRFRGMPLLLQRL